MSSPTDYLHPRYWLTWLGFGLLRLISLLPLPAIALMADALGSLMFRVMKSRRNIALKNVVVAYPEISNREREAIVKRCFQLIAFTTIGIGVNWWAPESRLRRLVTFDGKHHYDAAVEEGRNIILLAPHAIALEMAGLVMSTERPMITMYQHTRKLLLNDMVKAKRGRFKGLLVERKEPLRNLVKLIRAGNPFYYLPDQDAGDKGVFVPFFGIEASTYPMLSKFAKLSGAVVLPCFTYIRPKGQGWHVIVGPALEHFPGDSDEDDARRMNETIESMINVGPEQYFWVHKRYKTRPDGDTDFYADDVYR